MNKKITVAGTGYVGLSIAKNLSGSDPMKLLASSDFSTSNKIG